MTHLSNFLNEALRTYSPVPGLIQRILVRDIQLGKYTLKKGHNLNVQMMSSMNFDKYFLCLLRKEFFLMLANSTLIDGPQQTHQIMLLSHFRLDRGIVSDSI